MKTASSPPSPWKEPGVSQVLEISRFGVQRKGLGRGTLT